MEKYQKIYSDLLKALQEKVYQPGDFLPSDGQLVIRYHVSRETVRKAVKALANDGYVQRLPGRGSVVLDRKHFVFPVSTLESYREMVAQAHLDASNDVIAIKQNVPVPEKLTGDNSSILCTLVVRRRWVDGEEMVLDYDYINQAVIDHIPHEAAKNSLFDYFENQLGLQIDYAVKRMTVEKGTIEDRQLLHIDESMSMVVIRSETRLADNRILSFTESRHRADRFTSVEFARRHK
ncbi:trehalose operon repressor [Weissella paramesenteroides]|uniref:trehalose operon repressor n=1 Tax=Weissella paramesenteroides TaxID=1249 RepID=UPI003F745183